MVGATAKAREALTEIRKLKPDMVITETENEKPEAEMLLWRLLQNENEARVVRLNLHDSTAVCYVGCRCTAGTVEDLVRCLLKLTPPGSRERCRELSAKSELAR